MQNDREMCHNIVRELPSFHQPFFSFLVLNGEYGPSSHVVFIREPRRVIWGQTPETPHFAVAASSDRASAAPPWSSQPGR